MKRIILCFVLGLMFLSSNVHASEMDELLVVAQGNGIESYMPDTSSSPVEGIFERMLADRVDIWDIFVRSLLEVNQDDEDIQFFVDRLPRNARVFVQADPDGTRIFTYLTLWEFGCIAKILPAVPGERPELYMHIEDCHMSRYRESGKAVTNYIYHTVHTADGTQVEEFSSTATWSFHHRTDMVITTPDGIEYNDLWYVETIIVNTSAPALVQYYTVEGVGIVGKRVADISWQ